VKRYIVPHYVILTILLYIFSRMIITCSGSSFTHNVLVKTVKYCFLRNTNGSNCSPCYSGPVPHTPKYTSFQKYTSQYTYVNRHQSAILGNYENSVLDMIHVNTA